jgi:rare lipoprotein A
VATPETADADSWHGRASWYGDAFAGRRTASGARFDPTALTAAHRTLPFGTRVRVMLDATGRSVVVTITDRGPHVAGREIDLSRAAATAIGLTARGVGDVTLTRLGS